MEQQEIQQKVEKFLQDLGIPSFIVFGWQKGAAEGRAQFGVVSSQHKMPVSAAIKGLSWALNDLVNKAL
jgi:hypothetical protein